MSKLEFADGWVACLKKKDDTRYPDGSFFLYSEPHQSEQQAKDWAWAFEDSEIVRIEKNRVPAIRIVR